MKLYLNGPARAIGYAPETKTAYVGSGKRIWTLKVEKPANTEGLPISSEVNSIHVNLHDPDLVVLEVDVSTTLICLMHGNQLTAYVGGRFRRTSAVI
jgi:hypothetical protein